MCNAVQKNPNYFPQGWPVGLACLERWLALNLLTLFEIFKKKQKQSDHILISKANSSLRSTFAGVSGSRGERSRDECGDGERGECGERGDCGSCRCGRVGRCSLRRVKGELCWALAESICKDHRETLGFPKTQSFAMEGLY